MPENAINAKSEALELRELSSEELDPVSGGWFTAVAWAVCGGGGGTDDPGQIFQQIMRQVTQG